MANQKPRLRWLHRAQRGIATSRPAHPRLGVLSGIFNPPTRAHLALAEAAAERLQLDEVLFVLPETPPHKEQPEVSLQDRAAMLLQAITHSRKFSAAITTHGLFLDIHRALAREYPPQVQVFFLAGADAAERILLRWPYQDPAQALDAMFARFEFGVAGRGGSFSVPPDSLAARYSAKIHSLSLPPEYEALSATLARERVARGEPIEDMVPQEIASYIAHHGLYRRAHD